MEVIREIEEGKTNKKLTARVKMQQEIEGETDDKESSIVDESMGSVTHIPKETGVDNSDTESMSMDGKEESGSNGDGDGKEWTGKNEDSKEESSDSEEESSDNSSGENNTDDRSEKSDVSMLDKTEGNGGEVEDESGTKFGIKERQRIRVRTK